MKLKQTSPCEAMKLKGWVELGQAITTDGNQLIILADKKGWAKSYDARSQERLQQQYCEA